MASQNGRPGAPDEKPTYAVPLLRLRADDVAELERIRSDQRREELAMSADQVFDEFRALLRVADWIESARPIG